MKKESLKKGKNQKGLMWTMERAPWKFKKAQKRESVCSLERWVVGEGVGIESCKKGNKRGKLGFLY